ncbi:hypothetical protein SAMN06265348_111168 [Pedobacter westerhofensis]|uniref:Transposase, YhgA-like n=1 Tax=Pedobacter westerhofensis TaxID=425512 RepID=A0A521FDJ8_9SPHI|nr:hypothetical protein [Pedobacter westerhofensis]SMO94265.1 hypothetical protein SAMN06265348_111168 [Pedobacter westerhofensis]
MRKQNDTLWKGILEPFFREFLFLIDPALAASVDPAREIIFLDKELNQEIPSVEGIYEQKIVDKLIKLYMLDGTEEWILLHLEVQEKYRKDFSKRMFDYFNKLYDKYKKPITAYAIFTEASDIKRNNVFKMDCRGTSLQYIFNTYKIALQDEDMLRKNPIHLPWSY